jgi:uncharacterized protein YbjT (DUF2867 family)
MYVITGATGNTGHVIIKNLRAKGKPVRAIGRSAERLHPLAKQGAEPFVADLTDCDALTRAFDGAQAVYVMIPPDPASADYRAQQDRITDAMAEAIEKSGVEYAVALSSYGADKPDKTGPVVGLYRLEQRLRSLPGLNALALRAGYLMENTLAQLEPIEAMGTTVGTVQPDLKLPMVATRDVGEAAAEALVRLDFGHWQTRELLGQRDLTLPEATAIIGSAIGRPEIAYLRVAEDRFQNSLVQAGLSRNFAQLLTEMTEAMNSGWMRPLEPRSPRNTTPTSFEAFVAEKFVPSYRAKALAA